MLKCWSISFPLHDLFFGLVVWNIRSTQKDKWTLSTGTALALRNRMCHVAPGRSKQNWPCTICNSEHPWKSQDLFHPVTGQVPAVCWCFLSSATGPQPTGQCGGILQNSNPIRKDLMIGSVVVTFFCLCFTWGCCSLSHPSSLHAPTVQLQPHEAYSHGKVLGTMKHHNHLFLINEELLHPAENDFCHSFSKKKSRSHGTLQKVIGTGLVGLLPHRT